MADAALIAGTEKAIIMGVREALVYPFVCPNWLDFRVGFFLSLCSATDDSTITGLAEDIITVGQSVDRMWIGLKQSNSVQPANAGTTFLGYASALQPDTIANSRLLSSGIGGTDDANYWIAIGSVGGAFHMVNGTTSVMDQGSGIHIHFPQNAANAGGNATLVMFKLLRTTTTSTTIQVYPYYINVPGTNSFDRMYDSACLLQTIRDNFRSYSFPSSFGSGNIGTVPDALYFFWPFYKSKLRIHAVVIEKFA